MNKTYITDLHIHSKYSRATSPNLNLEEIYKWGKIKGINIIGTGDFTHPLWLKEIKEKLEPAEEGLFILKDEISKKIDDELPLKVKNNLMRFVLTVEISNIYKRHEKVRKVHNVLVVPNLKTAEKINLKLSKIGNLRSDGRPILGLNSEDLLKITLNANENSLFIPAHIWTPWFAMFGSKSGFDSIYEAFGENEKYIYAVETGLSSDPFMNWRIKDLNNRTLVSHSDAHSAQKLGREANIIQLNKLNYNEIANAIKTNDDRFVGTIEFFPEEGKYHNDGHRDCNISLTPEKSKILNNICPKCGKELTIGVLNRVSALTNQSENFKPKKHKKVEYIIPLQEVVCEIEKVKSQNSQKAKNAYFNLINNLGDEFEILRNTPLNKIEKVAGQEYKNAISKIRNQDVFVEAGYDGVFGKVKVFSPI